LRRTPEASTTRSQRPTSSPRCSDGSARRRATTPLTKVDTDLDGLDDCTEIKGALGTTGQRYVTDPGQADTDGDGIPDGAEISLEFSWSDLPPRPGAPVVEAPRTYTVFSDPTRVDTDGDGVDDGREGDLDTQPRWSDTDFDGLSDGSEIDDYVTNPLSSNSDGDDWGDAYEVTRADEGLDPQRPDTVLSAWDYVSHFLIGYVCGDFWPHDTISVARGLPRRHGDELHPRGGVDHRHCHGPARRPRQCDSQRLGGRRSLAAERGPPTWGTSWPSVARS
jgi:hypothetical protein